MNIEDKITFLNLCKLLKDIDSPLGDLCNDILRDKYIDYINPWGYLDRMCIGKYYLEKPYKDLKKIYNIINS